MRPNDARTVLQMLFGAYRVTADGATVLVYAEALEPFDRDVAAEAVHRLIRTSDRLPSVARLLEALRAEQRRTAPPALPEAKPANWREAGLAGIAAAREQLRAVPARPDVNADPELVAP